MDRLDNPLASLGVPHLSYAGFYEQTFECFVEKAASLGFSGVQLIPDQTPNLLSELTPQRLKAIARVLREHRLAVSLHSVFYDINLVSLVPEVQAFALSVAEHTALIGLDLGADRVTVHPGYMFPGWRANPVQNERFWRAARAGMERLAELGTALGTTFCLENGSYAVSSMTSQTRTPLHVGISPQEMIRLTDDLPDTIGFCLDVGKALASDYAPADFIAPLNKRLRQVQIGSLATAQAVWSYGKSWNGIDPKEIIFEGGETAWYKLENSPPI